MELEAKYRCVEEVGTEQVEALHFAPYRLGRRHFHDLRDTLLDTESRAIGATGYALRHRRDGERSFLTLKGPKVRRGEAWWRPEWETELVGGDPDDPATWPGQVGEMVRTTIGGAPLHPLFTVRNRRYSWNVWRDGIRVAEIVLDRGEIRAGGQVEPMHEIEVELKEGKEAELLPLIATLRAGLPLAPEERGKAARGFALLGEARDRAGSKRDEGIGSQK